MTLKGQVHVSNSCFLERHRNRLWGCEEIYGEYKVIFKFKTTQNLLIYISSPSVSFDVIFKEALSQKRIESGATNAVALLSLLC